MNLGTHRPTVGVTVHEAKIGVHKPTSLSHVHTLLQNVFSIVCVFNVTAYEERQRL